MIQITDHPGTLAAGTALHSLHFYGNGLAYASAYSAAIEFDENNQVGDKLSLSFGNGSINLEFETVASPDDNGLEFEAGSAIEDVISVMQSNYILAKYFTIEEGSTSGYIAITSKGNGSFYFIDWDFSEANSHFQIDTYEGGQDASSLNNYQSVWACTRNGNDLFDGFYFDIPPSLDQNLDLGKLLSKLLAYPYPHADNDSLLVIPADTLQMSTAEFFNGAYQKKYTWTAFKYLPFAEPTEDYLTTLAASGKFIHPAPYKVWDAAKPYLYYLSMDDSKTYNVKVSIYYTNNSSSLVDVYAKYADKADLLMIPAGINDMNLKSFNPDKTIWSYQVKLYDGTTKVAETDIIYRVEEPEFAEQFFYRTDKSVFHVSCFYCFSRKGAKCVNKIEFQKYFLPLLKKKDKGFSSKASFPACVTSQLV